MATCIICRFDAPLDDAVVLTAAGRCICLLCYGRATGTARPMPGVLGRALTAALAPSEVA